MVILRIKDSSDKTVRYRSVAAFDVNMEDKVLDYTPYPDGREWHEVHYKDIKINVSPSMVVVPIIEIDLENDEEFDRLLKERE